MHKQLISYRTKDFRAYVQYPTLRVTVSWLPYRGSLQFKADKTITNLVCTYFFQIYFATKMRGIQVQLPQYIYLPGLTHPWSDLISFHGPGVGNFPRGSTRRPCLETSYSLSVESVLCHPNPLRKEIIVFMNEVNSYTFITLEAFFFQILTSKGTQRYRQLF